MRKTETDQLVNKILNAYTDRRLIVGLDGLNRSGKTTLVKTLKEKITEKQINVFILHIDDYIVQRKSRYNTGKEEWYEYYQLQWDADYLQQSLFSKLKVDREISLFFYNSKADELEKKQLKTPAECIVIIEGVFLQREEWRDFFDLVLYLDCPREIRFERESINTKGKIEKFKMRYWKAEDHYMDTINPLEKADIVIR